MRKYRVYIIIAIIIMIIPILRKTFTNNHKIDYKINEYEINEEFNINNKDHDYKFLIKKKDEQYSYIINKNIHKQKKIIKDIKEYTKGNIKCIVPIYINKIDKEIFCLEDKKQVSKYYLINNENFHYILKKIKKYNIDLPTDSNKKTNYKKIIVYQHNIPKNSSFILWNYKGIDIFNSEKIISKKFLKNDLYENIMSTTTSRYFVLFDNTNVMGIDKVYCYDIKKNKYKTFQLKEKISKDSYINGEKKDLIYITDNQKKVEYTLNIKTEKLEVVGNDERGYTKFINDEKINLTKSDFFSKKNYFKNERILNNKITSSKDLIQENNVYYFLEENKLYKNIDGYNNILLFEMKNIKDWFVINNNVILFIDNIVYLYNDIDGLKKIIEYNELNYNYKNIIKFWE